MEELKLTNVDRIFLLSDVHFGLKDGSDEWIENMVDYFDNFFIPLLNNSPSAGPNKCIVIAGDFFDNRKHIDISAMHHAILLMKKLSDICPVVIDTGNHDIYKKSETDVSSLDCFWFMENVHIVKVPTTLEVANGKKLFIVPWIGDPKEETKLINANKSSHDVIITHTEISGMSFDNNRPIINGVDLTSISKKIYSGHIHTRQESKKCNYLGSPYDMSRSDIGNVKGVYTLHVGKTIQEHFYENTRSPRFVRVQYDIDPARNEWTPDMIRNNYVDVVIKKSQMGKIHIPTLTDTFVDEYKAKRVEFKVEDDTIIKKVDSSVAASADSNISEIFEEKIQTIELGDKEFERLKEMNDKYLKEAEKQL